MYYVQGYDAEGPLDDDECETMDDVYQAVDQMVMDGATNVEVVNGSGDVIYEYTVGDDD